MKIIFTSNRNGLLRSFGITASKIENREGDIYADGNLVAWYNECDNGWFIRGGYPNKPKDVTYWDSMVIS